VDENKMFNYIFMNDLFLGQYSVTQILAQLTFVLLHRVHDTMTKL